MTNNEFLIGMTIMVISYLIDRKSVILTGDCDWYSIKGLCMNIFLFVGFEIFR